MIEINLSPKKKQTALTNVMGVDLSLLNVKMLAVALFVLYVPETLISSHYEDLTSKETSEQTELRREYREVSGKVRSMENIKRQVDALRAQEEKLARRLEAVKQVINKRQNPFGPLKYIAENIPQGLWLVSMELEDRQVSMRGYSKNFKNISRFLENLKDSIFFKKNISYERPESLPDTVDGVKLEVFEIKTEIASFE